MKITCGVPGDQCPWDNCDTCDVGAAWIEEQNKLKKLEFDACQETAERARKAYKEYGPLHDNTKKAGFIRDACRRMMALEPIGHECPKCRHPFARGVNFCSSCGQRITWRTK